MSKTSGAKSGHLLSEQGTVYVHVPAEIVASEYRYADRHVSGQQSDLIHTCRCCDSNQTCQLLCNPSYFDQLCCQLCPCCTLYVLAEFEFRGPSWHVWHLRPNSTLCLFRPKFLPQNVRTHLMAYKLSCQAQLLTKLSHSDTLGHGRASPVL